MTAFYNEIDPFAAAWLRNLIAGGHIAPGVVDERDIRDIRPDELAEFDQVHFFAGIGGWSYALRLAGWPDDRPVWTGSCPCQPFSAAGRGGGFADERHLWPHFHHLIRECRPGVVFGEQVASKDGLAWLDLVQADLEGTDYAVWAADLCAAGVGAPHIRQRLYWVADALHSKRRPVDVYRQDGRDGPDDRWQEVYSEPRAFSEVRGLDDSGGARTGRDGRAGDPAEEEGPGERGVARLVGDAPCASSADGGMAHAHGRDAGTEGLQRSGEHGQQPADGRASRVAQPESQQQHGAGDAWRGRREPTDGGTGSIVADANNKGLSVGPLAPDGSGAIRVEGPAFGAHGAISGPWSDCDWLYCTDGKWRPVESGTFPLAHGVPNRVGSLRGYGNAINPTLAAEFIGAYAEAAGVF